MEAGVLAVGADAHFLVLGFGDGVCWIGWGGVGEGG